jgi:hypothetical protein
MIVLAGGFQQQRPPTAGYAARAAGSGVFSMRMMTANMKFTDLSPIIGKPPARSKPNFRELLR